MAFNNRVPRVLYFHAGNNPTDEQKKDAERFGLNVGFRSSDQVASLAMSPLEECDAVAGEVPDRYAAIYPNVSNFDPAERLARMSDYDRAHGPVHALDNEAARASKAPSLGGDRVLSQGAVRPAGAMTSPVGGFVAPSPGNPDNLSGFGSERAENGPEGSDTSGQRSRLNPQGLPDTGVSLPATGTTPAANSGPVADGGGQSGFRAPAPAEDTEADKETKATAKAKAAAS